MGEPNKVFQSISEVSRMLEQTATEMTEMENR